MPLKINATRCGERAEQPLTVGAGLAHALGPDILLLDGNGVREHQHWARPLCDCDGSIWVLGELVAFGLSLTYRPPHKQSKDTSVGIQTHMYTRICKYFYM